VDIVSRAKTITAVLRTPGSFIACFWVAGLVGLAGFVAVGVRAAQPEAGPPKDVAVEADQPVVIVLRGGQRFRGMLVREDADGITVRVGSIETRIAHDQIDQVIRERPLVERYRSMRAAIDDDDIKRLLLLAEWLRANGLLDAAQMELEGILLQEPRNGEAIRLMRLVEEQMDLREKTVVDRPEGADGGSQGRTARARPRRLPPGEFPLLTGEQINLLKVYEIDLDDPPRLVIDRETVDEFLDRYGDDPSIPVTSDGREAFQRRPDIEILKEMFRLRARDLYRRVDVLGVPEALRRFRDHVNATWLVNHCATTRCHGGLDSGRLMLFNRDPRAEHGAFTNFLILDRFRLSSGEPLIDYAVPERSPLLQMTLPRNRAAKPHPEVYGWRPVLRDTEHRRFQQAVEWIRAMHRPRPDYPIDYEPPRPLTPPDPGKGGEPIGR